MLSIKLLLDTLWNTDPIHKFLSKTTKLIVSDDGFSIKGLNLKNAERENSQVKNELGITREVQRKNPSNHKTELDRRPKVWESV